MGHGTRTLGMHRAMGWAHRQIKICNNPLQGVGTGAGVGHGSEKWDREVVLGQGSGAGTWDRNMRRGRGPGTWDRDMEDGTGSREREHGTRDVETGVWDREMRQGHLDRGVRTEA